MRTMAARLWFAPVLAVCALFAAVPSAAAAGRSEKPRSEVLFRPVLCAAPAYAPSTTPVVTRLRSSSCSAASLLTASNMAVAPGNGAAGFTSNIPQPEAGLASVPTTTATQDVPSHDVLLPGLPRASLLSMSSSASTVRYVLGPAELTSSSVATARAFKNQTGAWTVDYAMTASGAVLWNKVAKENFHQLLAIDLNGVVVSAPILQPTQLVFSSFDGKGEISGNLTKSEAFRLARALRSGRT